MTDTGVVQMSIREGQVEQNLDTAMTLISNSPGAQIYLLPELFTTGYAQDSWPAAGKGYDAIVERLSSFAREVGAVLCGSMIARESDRLFNRMVAIFPDSQPMVVYDKIHLFGLMKEDVHLRAGTSLSVFRTLGLAFGMALCYDLRFPSMFQRMAPATDVYLVSSEWPEPRCEIMKLLARARAAENQCYLLLSNRCGAGKEGTVFCGHSMLIAPDGTVKADAANVQTVLRVPVFQSEVLSTRKMLHVFEDRVDGIDTPGTG